MSAIADFLAELRRQREALEWAHQRDELAELILRGGNVSGGTHRIWTSRDKRRVAEIDAEPSPRPDTGLPIDLPPVDVSGAESSTVWANTRVGRIIEQYLSKSANHFEWDREGRRSIAPLADSAINEVRRACAADLVPIIRTMEKAHYAILLHFWEKRDDIDAEPSAWWGDIAESWDETIGELERLAPGGDSLKGETMAKRQTTKSAPPQLPADGRLLVDEENRVVAASGGERLRFDGNKKPFELFLLLHRAGQPGRTTAELQAAIYPGVGANNSRARLDKVKERLNLMLADVHVEVSADGRGIWRLSPISTI